MHHTLPARGAYAWRNLRIQGQTRYPFIPTGTAILPIN